MTTSGKRQVLGTGLDRLLGDIKEVPITTPHKTLHNNPHNNSYEGVGDETGDKKYREVAIANIIPNPNQPRQSFDRDKLQELSISLQRRGVIQPLLVRPHPRKAGQYELVAGERRWRAAHMAGLHSLPVVVRDLDNAETLEVALIENLQRDDLNPIDIAEAYQKLLSEFNYSHEELANHVGKSRSTITNDLRLLSLSKDIREWIKVGKLSAAHGRNLVGVVAAEKLAMMAMTEQWSVRRLEREAKNWKDDSGKKPFNAIKAQKSKHADIVDWEKKLTNHLAMKVVIDIKGGGKGTLQAQFVNANELARLIKLLYNKK